MSEEISPEEVLEDDFKSYVAYFTLLTLRASLTCPIFYDGTPRGLLFDENYEQPAGPMTELPPSVTRQIRVLTSQIVMSGYVEFPPAHKSIDEALALFADAISRGILARTFGRTFTGDRLSEAISHSAKVIVHLFRDYRDCSGLLSQRYTGAEGADYNKCAQVLSAIYEVLDSFEVEYYDRLSKGYRATVKGLAATEVKAESLRRFMGLLADVRREKLGSVVLLGMEGTRGVTVPDNLVELFDELADANIILRTPVSASYRYVIPAPLFEMSINELLGST